MIPVREFTEPGALRAHYAALHRKSFPAMPLAHAVPAPPVPVAPAPPPVAEADEAVLSELDRAIREAARQSIIRTVVADNTASIGKGAHVPSAAVILAAVCRVYGTTRAAISSEMKSYAIVRPRQVAFCLMREDGLRSWGAIGNYIGKDHSTVLHGHKKIAALLAGGDCGLAEKIEACRALYREGEVL